MPHLEHCKRNKEEDKLNVLLEGNSQRKNVLVPVSALLKNVLTWTNPERSHVQIKKKPVTSTGTVILSRCYCYGTGMVIPYSSYIIKRLSYNRYGREIHIYPIRYGRYRRRPALLMLQSSNTVATVPATVLKTLLEKNH